MSQGERGTFHPEGNRRRNGLMFGTLERVTFMLLKKEQCTSADLGRF